MALEPLVASAKRSVWRMNDHAGEADKAFAKVRKAILESADYQCGYCEQRSEKWQEVHHKDDDHSNNKGSNLLCVCPLCHQVFHLGLAGIMSGAQVIYLPEYSQEEVNQIALVSWLIQATDKSKLSQSAKDFVLTLEGKSKFFLQEMEGRRGNTRNLLMNFLTPMLKERGVDPAKVEMAMVVKASLWADLLMALPDELYANRQALLGGLRVYPKRDRFPEQIKHWGKESEEVLSVSIWDKIISDADVIELVNRVKADTNKRTPVGV